LKGWNYSRAQKFKTLNYFSICSSS